jgi:hypothetical protein
MDDARLTATAVGPPARAGRFPAAVRRVAAKLATMRRIAQDRVLLAADNIVLLFIERDPM